MVRAYKATWHLKVKSHFQQPRMVTKSGRLEHIRTERRESAGREERAYVPFMYMGASAMVEERSRTTSPKNDNDESERENDDHEDERENGGEREFEGR